MTILDALTNYIHELLPGGYSVTISIRNYPEGLDNVRIFNSEGLTVANEIDQDINRAFEDALNYIEIYP